MHIIVFIAIDVPGGGNVDNSEIATIEDLLRRYCYVVDDAQWDALSEVFTAEVRFVNEFSGTDIQGIERVTNWYRTMTARPPRARSTSPCSTPGSSAPASTTTRSCGRATAGGCASAWSS